MHEQFCIISDRPRVMKVDDFDRPHCDDGPFCAWSDGFALYAIHGVRVPRYVVESPEKITVEKIKAEANQEVRRIMIERFGPGRYIKATGARLIDMDYRNVIGGGPRALYELDDQSRWMVCTDGSTKRVYHLPVPQEAKTCSEAHSMICGFDENLILQES